MGDNDKAFVVRHTSVSNAGGYGVYALKDFKAGSVLPLTYPGVCVSARRMEQLNKFLALLTQKKYTSNKERQGDISLLKTEWNITIANVNYITTLPQWDDIYDTFLAYRFGVVYWNVYNWNGNIIADWKDPLNAPLYINEACPFEGFVNQMTDRVQKSAYNIEPRLSQNGKVEFVSILDISCGDELLFFYGSNYTYCRTYEIFDPTTMKKPPKSGVFKAKTLLV